jgi:hypothetical protein
MKLNKKQLPFFAAAVQTIQYSFGGWLYFSWIGIPVVGSMGALISFSVAYAASQISDIAKGRKLVSWLAMSVLMLLSPVIIGTSLFYSLPMITNPAWRGVVSAVWGLLPDGATALAGFIAGKGMMESEGKPKVAGNDGGKKKSKQKVAGKQKSKDVAIAAEPLTNENLIAYIARETKGNKKPSHNKIAKHFGVSRQAISQRLEKMKPIDVTQEMKS